jgi:hypothetical protein
MAFTDPHMTKTVRNLLFIAALLAVPSIASAVEPTPSAHVARLQVSPDAPTRDERRPLASNPVIIDDPQHPSLLPEWHPQGMGDRVSLAMLPELPGAQVRLNVKF